MVFNMDSNQEKTLTLQEQDSGKSLNINSKLCIEPETHLQSLGFSMNNGKARFMLDDDTPLYSNAALSHFNIVDEDDSLSFVVLGKDSVDSIKASSLASYVDIQQKSMSIDYNSMIASLDSTEVQQKLNELLQENGKLKETLKQNNIAMKQQFNTLASWQEEMMKVHQSHKKKFGETRELINYLKQENADLKMKLTAEQVNDTVAGFEFCSMTEVESHTPMSKLKKKVSSLTDELSISKVKCEKLSTDVEKLLGISNLMSSQLKQATSTIQEQRLNIKKLEVEAAMSKSSDSSCLKQSFNNGSFVKESLNSCTEGEKCRLKDKEINSLKELIVTLEHKLEHATAPVQFCIRSSVNPKECDKQHTQKVEQCDEKLQESIEMDKYGLNFNSILHDFETTLGEKSEESTMNSKTFSEPTQKAADLGKNIQDKQLLEEERRLLIKEKESLEEEKKLLSDQKKKFEMEYENWNKEKELLRQERINLDQEKSSLDRQSQLYESLKKSLGTEKEKFDAKYEQLVTEIGTLHECIQKKETVIQELQNQMQIQLDNIKLVQTQLHIYEEDFRQERKVKEALLDEKSKLDADLQKQIDFNEQLQQEVTRLISESNGQVANQDCPRNLVPPLLSTLSCPACTVTFNNMDSLQQHVEHCLSLD